MYRTLFGKLRLPSVRLYHCVCQPHPTRTFSPLAQLLSERTAPELLYLETKFSSLMSYGLSVQLLQEVLPIEHAINAATVRNHVHAVAQRIDAELGDEQVLRFVCRGSSFLPARCPEALPQTEKGNNR